MFYLMLYRKNQEKAKKLQSLCHPYGAPNNYAIAPSIEHCCAQHYIFLHFHLVSQYHVVNYHKTSSTSAPHLERFCALSSIILQRNQCHNDGPLERHGLDVRVIHY